MGELQPGEEVVTSDGGRSRLVAKERRGAGPEYVYNLEVWRDHNFHVGESKMLVNDGCSGAVKKAILDAMLALPSITKHFKVYECRPAAKAMRDYLLKKGITDFEIILLKVADEQSGKLLQVPMASHKYLHGMQAIATNGIHLLLVINGKAYDNLSRGVVDAQEYIDSFFDIYNRKVKPIVLKHNDDLDRSFMDD